MLTIAALSKRYGERVALDGLNLELAGGQFVALLGPNGAGKSTLFQLLTGLFVPSAGEIRIAGFDLRRQARAALARIGVVFQQLSLDLDLSVRRNLRLHADLHGLPRAQARSRIEHECERAGITDDLDRAPRELSGGTRRKVELVRALLHRPSLLLMDEATVGLDPKSRRDLLAAIRSEVADRGVTVLWATHRVEEAESADRVLLLHRGRLLADDAPAAVTRALGGHTLEDGFVRATT
jgi:ABC-2 type transport system ATP-binding protein